jgi:SAM-dependent methyltransferase
MARPPREPNWRAWLESWDRQQESFNPDRERRFEAMFDVLAARLPPRFTALDLGSGPGSLSLRLLRRFPRARVIAVDFDPVLLRVGQGALRGVFRRVTWVDTDLGSPGWTEQLPSGRIDAAVSTTALHWLRPAELRRVYRDLQRILRPGAVFLNGDYLPWDSDRRRLRRLAESVRTARTGGKSLAAEWGPWRHWWARVERERALAPLVRERQARFGGLHPHREPTSIGFHERALRQAGFREVAVVWQDLENRVLFAVR